MSKITEDDSIADEEVTVKKEEIKEIEIGSYKSHVETARKGIQEYKIWSDLTQALIAMAYPNVYHRIDLRDKEILKRLEVDLETKIDYDYIKAEIIRKPFLVYPNGTKVVIEVDKTKDINGKPLTKKAMKANEKRDKIQNQINTLQQKFDKINNKKCPRAEKIQQKIEELEKKKDRM